MSLIQSLDDWLHSHLALYLVSLLLVCFNTKIIGPSSFLKESQFAFYSFATNAATPTIAPLWYSLLSFRKNFYLVFLSHFILALITTVGEWE